jgi:hypothetical protein
VAELRVLDQDVAGRVGAGQDAVLVIVQEGVAQREAGAVQAQGGAVLVGHLGAEHLDVVDGDVAAGNHPSPFAHGVLAGGVDLRTAVHAADGDVAGVDAADVAAVGGVAGDLDHVAAPGDGEGFARGSVGFARTHRQGGGRWQNLLFFWNKKTEIPPVGDTSASRAKLDQRGTMANCGPVP